MGSKTNTLWIVFFSLLFIGLNGVFIFFDNYFFSAFPLVLVVIYLGIYHLKTTFLSVALFTPLSINLEDFTDGRIGLFLPTEPLLFGLLLLLIIKQTHKPFLPNYTWRHPITWVLLGYLAWGVLTSITSYDPVVSFKYMLMKTWFIIPLLFLGVYVFENKKNIIRFLWLLVISMSVIMVYTLIRHYGYSFGEKEGHWVMEPFYKDHTIYGAGVAMNLFFVLGLYLYKKHNPLVLFTLICFLIINLAALYFSYTRGAWLSVIVAITVWLFIYYKIKFKYLFVTGVAILLIVFLSWDNIQMALAKNSAEHTTEDFSERMQSASNITSDASNLERLNRWESAWRMFLDRPIVGFGPGTYAFAYAPYQDPDKLTIISTNFGDAGNAHSEYLGPLAEMGLPGFLIMVLLVIVIFYKGITLYIKYPEKEFKMILLCILLALVTYFFHGILNNYLDTDKAAVPVYGACAIIIVLEEWLRRNGEVMR